MQDNKTLNIAGLKRGGNLEEVITRHFREWGELEAIKVVYDKAVAFVKFKLRASAEFAKEAMQDQSLDQDEVLTVKWSSEDPDPESQEKHMKELKDLARKIVKKQEAENPTYAYGEEEDAPQDQFPSMFDPSAYPNTNTQFVPDAPSNSQSIADWLKKYRLAHYSNAIMSGGYYDLQSLKNLDEIGLDALGITEEGHRKILLDAVKEIPEQQADSSQYAYYSSSYYYHYPQYAYTNQEYQGEQPTGVASVDANQPQKSEEPPQESKKSKEKNSSLVVDYNSDE